MRLITRRKIYRAFPELDSLSDERCEELLRRVHLSSKRGGVLLLAVVSVGVGSFILAFICAMLLLQEVDLRRLEVDLYVSGRTWLYLLGRAGVAVGVVAPPLLLALLTRDLVLGAFLKNALSGHLKRTACPGCKYQLLGLSVDESGAVRCPECGGVVTLRELGLDGPEDLLARPTLS